MGTWYLARLRAREGMRPVRCLPADVQVFPQSGIRAVSRHGSLGGPSTRERKDPCSTGVTTGMNLIPAVSGLPPGRGGGVWWETLLFSPGLYPQKGIPPSDLLQRIDRDVQWVGIIGVDQFDLVRGDDRAETVSPVSLHDGQRPAVAADCPTELDGRHQS